MSENANTCQSYKPNTKKECKNSITECKNSITECKNFKCIARHYCDIYEVWGRCDPECKNYICRRCVRKET